MRLFPRRRRPRAVAQERHEETPSMDWIAFALAIWLSALVGAQLLAQLPALAGMPANL